MKRRLGLLYLLLLVASTLWQWLASPTASIGDAPVVELADGTLLGWREFGRADSDLVVVLLHGSPMSGASMQALGRGLESRLINARVLIPDMPGFGLSKQRLADYSFKAHGSWTREWLAAIEVDQAHFVAYSMGSGVALSLYAESPDLVDSLVMLSAIGVQELELLGNYEWNHVVHQFQHSAVAIVHALVPHFGAWEDALIGHAYTRNFLDSDQRPMRSLLRGFEPPMLIIHGEDDNLVPFQAAREHARIVPHALVDYRRGGHGLVFSEPDALAESIAEFVVSAEARDAPSRQLAELDRLEAAQVVFDRHSIPPVSGLALLVVALGIIVISYVSEDFACIVAGLIAAAGTITLPQAALFAFIGIYSGDFLVYSSGRWARSGGERWLKRSRGSARLQQAAQWFHERGAIAVVLARFIPGTRFPVFFSAGLARMHFLWFAMLLLVPALIWTPALTGLAWWGGDKVVAYLALFRMHGWQAAVIIGLLLLILVKSVPLFLSRNARRLAWGRWQRRLRWEFWSPWAIYLPLVPYFIWLALRYRGATVFTAANPGMPAGGLIGESKQAILGELNVSERPRWLYIADPQDASSLACIETWRQAESLDYPLVVKPEFGERGQGVNVVRSATELEEHLSHCMSAQIIQAYVDGQEFGVFYFRFPDQERGQIFSITEKQPIKLVGDGHRSLRQLIIDDDRAVMMAAVHFSKHAVNLDKVVEEDHEVELVEVGTHALGCVFLDGARYVSPQLEETIERISRAYQGFYFGRYDLKVPSVQALKSGQQITLIELNGVSSEATHIYDPRYGVFQAWRTLARQWRVAYAIGAANRDRGDYVEGPLAVIRRVLAARR